MASTSEALPPSSQKSTARLLSDPPDSNEEVQAEIIVTNGTHSSKDDSVVVKMARTCGALNRNTNTERERPKRQTRPKRISPVSDVDFGEKEIKVSLSASKGRTAAKRSQLGMPAKTNGSAPPAAKKARVAGRSKRWEPDNVTQNPRSPLVDADLRALLLQPAAWDCLTAEDRREIIALFPDETHILDAGTPNARPNLESLRNDDNFRHDAEQYVTNLAKGMHDPAWLKDAWTAHHRRAAGEFDAFYIRKLEVDWNVTIPDEFKPPHLRQKKGESPAGQSADGEGSRKEEPGVVDSTAEKKTGAAKGGAVEPPSENIKADTASIKNSEGAPSSTEAAESSVKDSLKGCGSHRCRVADGQVALDEKLPGLDTNGEKSPANATTHDTAEGVLGGSQKDPGINNAETIAADEEAAGPEDSMEVDGPEARVNSG